MRLLGNRTRAGAALDVDRKTLTKWETEGDEGKHGPNFSQDVTDRYKELLSQQYQWIPASQRAMKAIADRTADWAENGDLTPKDLPQMAHMFAVLSDPVAMFDLAQQQREYVDRESTSET